MKRTSRIRRQRTTLTHRRAIIDKGPARSLPISQGAAAVPQVDEPSLDSGPQGTIRLARATSQWAVGDWESLATLTVDKIEDHPERDRLALLVACAHLQRHDKAEAEQHLRRALAWGCDPRLAARLLCSGVHNGLGRIAALREDPEAVSNHFGKALELTGDRESVIVAHSRAVREMSSLGLLPQAASLLNQRLDSLDVHALRPTLVESEIAMLRSEVELLQHQFALSVQHRSLDLCPSTSDASTFSAPIGFSCNESLRQLSPSQLGQDLWVLERTGFKKGGFFVEFGATDGILLSNSWLLERHFGWTGICAEPNPRFFEKLKRNRHCTLTPACIAGQSGELLEFVLADEYGGFERNIAIDQHAAKREAYRNTGHRITVKTESLHDLLTRLGAPRHIDYLSIDTEGSEYEILSTFPLDLWRVRCITVEHNFGPQRERIQALLESAGYLRTPCEWDDFYERNDLA